MQEISELNVKENQEGVSFKIRVQPRSSRNKVAGVYGDSLKISITSPPVDGEANDNCILFIAKLFDISRSQVTITAGLTNRTKTIKISGINIDQFHKIVRSSLK